MADEPKTDEPAQTPGDQQQRRVEVTDKNAISLYANFCRVTGTPEELILDFGLNAQPFGVPTEPVDVKQRIVVNYFTAKRMLQALHMSVQRHEQAFGVLETDVQKRVVGQRSGGAAGAGLGRCGRRLVAEATSPYRGVAVLGVCVASFLQETRQALWVVRADADRLSPGEHDPDAVEAPQVVGPAAAGHPVDAPAVDEARPIGFGRSDIRVSNPLAKERDRAEAGREKISFVDDS